MHSLVPNVTIPDPKADYKAAEKLGQFRIGPQAVYVPAFPGSKYIPIEALAAAWVQKGTVSSKGSCGAQFPVFVLRLKLTDGTYQNLTFDKAAQADRALELIRSARPQLPDTE